MLSVFVKSNPGLYNISSRQWRMEPDFIIAHLASANLAVYGPCRMYRDKSAQPRIETFGDIKIYGMACPPAEPRNSSAQCPV